MTPKGGNTRKGKKVGVGGGEEGRERAERRDRVETRGGKRGEDTDKFGRFGVVTSKSRKSPQKIAP